MARRASSHSQNWEALTDTRRGRVAWPSLTPRGCASSSFPLRSPLPRAERPNPRLEPLASDSSDTGPDRPDRRPAGGVEKRQCRRPDKGKRARAGWWARSRSIGCAAPPILTIGACGRCVLAAGSVLWPLAPFSRVTSCAWPGRRAFAVHSSKSRHVRTGAAIHDLDRLGKERARRRSRDEGRSDGDGDCRRSLDG